MRGIPQGAISNQQLLLLLLLLLLLFIIIIIIITEEETLETGIAKGTLLKSRLNKSFNQSQSVLEYLFTNNKYYYYYY